MIRLRTVLCPIDFSPATTRQVDFAADLCRAFGGRLVLHHNRPSFGTGASVGWMYKADHRVEPPARIEAKLNECLTRVPDDVAHEGLITEGPVSRAVLSVAEAIDADLVVLTAHGTLSDGHASITEQMLERSGRAVLVLHEPAVEPRTPRFTSQGADRQVVLVPTDLTPNSRSAVALGLDLARSLRVDLHLLHLVSPRRRDQLDEDAVRTQLHALVPGDLGHRVTAHVEQGDVATGIVRMAERLNASCIVMGEHARSPLRGWFGRDTPRAVLHQAHCPVWYVPGSQSGTGARSM
jgi:nucleotide-binding universal stress UspA family protein